MGHRKFDRLNGKRSHGDGFTAHGKTTEEVAAVIDVFVIAVKGKDVVIAGRNIGDLERPIAHRECRTEPELDAAVARRDDYKRSPRNSGAIRDFPFDSSAIALQQHTNRITAGRNRQGSCGKVSWALFDTRDVRVAPVAAWTDDVVLAFDRCRESEFSAFVDLAREKSVVGFHFGKPFEKETDAPGGYDCRRQPLCCVVEIHSTFDHRGSGQVHSKVTDRRAAIDNDG